ncbi:hypothetical protein V5R04_15530 [Jonesiaceae bacterium BS-20]|uniref:Uncharacterized protein n=1 Tax=Jonesiaceae bacterium BS-20 TaxID=3120821 RepID=A0AAU7DVT9_9MICO
MEQLTANPTSFAKAMKNQAEIEPNTPAPDNQKQVVVTFRNRGPHIYRNSSQRPFRIESIDGHLYIRESTAIVAIHAPGNWASARIEPPRQTPKDDR